GATLVSSSAAARAGGSRGVAWLSGGAAATALARAGAARVAGGADPARAPRSTTGRAVRVGWGARGARLAGGPGCGRPGRIPRGPGPDDAARARRYLNDRRLLILDVGRQHRHLGPR